MDASSAPSSFKAKIFMTFDEDKKEKISIHNGDCIRLKQSETDSYLTTSSMVVEKIIPEYPDFLKG